VSGWGGGRHTKAYGRGEAVEQGFRLKLSEVF
jgi:hypothetical protein